MKEFIKKLLSSLDTHSKGYSGRKLSALAGVMIAAYITIKELPESAQLHALYAWLLFVLVCLGIVTIEQIIKLKNGSTDNPTP